MHVDSDRLEYSKHLSRASSLQENKKQTIIKVPSFELSNY